MDAALLDVLEHGAHVGLVAVAERVDVELDGVLEEGVQVDGMVGRDLRGLLHVAGEVLVVVDDGHAAPAQHVAGTNQQGVPDAPGHPPGLVDGLGHARGRVGDLEAVEQGGEAVAVLGEVDGLGLGPHDGHAGGLEARRQVDGGLAAQRDDDPRRPLDLDDVHDVLEGERLEVQAVGRVVVGRDGLGVAVDHDRLEAQVAQGIRGVHAAVVELYALADAVGAGREDHHARTLCLDMLGGAAAHVGEVVVAGVALELAGAGVDRLDGRSHAQDLAQGAHDLLALAGEVRQLRVREAHLLGRQHAVGREAREAQPGDCPLRCHDVCDAVEEPRVDTRHLAHALDRPAAAQGLCHVEDALGRGAGHQLVEAVLVEGVAAVGSQAGMPLLERAHGLLEGLLEGGAYGHDLAHRLHARGEGVLGALELLEGEARHLDHAVVDGRLEAGRRGAGDVVGDLVEGVAHREQRRHLGDGKARGLAGERRGAAHARVHLDDDEAAVIGVHGKLHVGAAAGHAHALEHRQRVVAQALELEVVERLAGRHGDRVARVHAHGVEVLDGAHDDAVAGDVAHDLHLDLLPALEALLDEHLAVGRERKALLGNAQQVIVVVGHTAAGTAQREGRAQHHRVADVRRDGLALPDRVRHARARHLEADVAHGPGKELAVLAALDAGDVAADDLDAKALEHAGLRQLDRAVECRLAAHVGQEGVRSLALDDLGHARAGDGLHVGAVGRLGVGHDGGGVGVDKHHLVALGAKRPDRLGAGVVELAGLADHDGAGANDQDLLDVLPLGH